MCVVSGRRISMKEEGRMGRQIGKIKVRKGRERGGVEEWR